MNEPKNNLITQLVKLVVVFIVAWFLVLLVFTAASPNEEIPDKYNGLTVLLALVIAFAATLVMDYNKVTKLKSRIQKAKADIEAVNETADTLIDKAERVADKYRGDETAVYKEFAEARKGGRAIRSSKDFKAVMEAYPELQANVHTQRLLQQIEATENAKLNARTDYSAAVARYNAKIHSFPVVLLRKACKWEDVATHSTLQKDELVSDEDLGI